jgi:hypothetical protein
VRLALYVAIAVLYGLHNDLFLWDDARRVLGLPVGLTYHVAYCFAAAGLMALLVVFGWPDELEAPSHDEERKTAP